ncbi:formyl-CoA transferase [Burkholderia lata]|uniref:Formyl-CoA transferase n=1 Tax=Burkholderia lata (strain ATCC 17760 / DSM 23089 / LMG 22485 / NCIMB 9086 / R18194 / 383) TaxID=482957 RepID=A0A6P2JXC4_BURL3|nr:CaiB/BaiF CoA-transferase family protein [Burkholderia lata]VWB48974.1 formyl-CoA transferase [Burkholderia lata]
MPLPLEGIRILSLAEQYPGPFATLILADLGAEVVLVERPPAGDPARAQPNFHAALNRNKRAVAVDLKTEAGKAALRGLIPGADVLFEGFRPGVMARLGFGYDDVAAINPRCVYVSISGFGQHGPYRNRPAHDLSYQAICGLLFRQAATGNPEPLPELAIGDLTAAMFAVAGCLAALYQRAGTGRGCYVDVSMTDGLVSWMAASLGPLMNGGRPGLAEINAEPAYGIYRCADNRLLSLSIAYEDWFWKPLCGLLEMPDVADAVHSERVQHEIPLRGRIGDAISRRSRDEWAALLDGAGIPWGPVNTLDEVVADPHFKARGLFAHAADRDGRQRWHVAQPLMFDGVRPGPVSGVPVVGEDDEVLLPPQ